MRFGVIEGLDSGGAWLPSPRDSDAGPKRALLENVVKGLDPVGGVTVMNFPPHVDVKNLSLSGFQ